MDITYEELLKINEFICKKNNQKSVVINENNLKSALGNQQWYDNIEEKACALFRSLIIAHGFQDGNKRTAVLALVGQVTPNVSENDLALTAVMVATGELRSIEEIQTALFKLDN